VRFTTKEAANAANEQLVLCADMRLLLLLLLFSTF
jgi:hypothetical protein